MSCFVQYAPYHLNAAATGTPSASASATPCRPTLESFFPGFGDLVLHREVVTPLDIERVAGLTEGNIFAGEFLAPQMYFFRPAPGWSQYRTPIDGYYQCGSGTHPGGCVIGAPGQARQPADPARPVPRLSLPRPAASAPCAPVLASCPPGGGAPPQLHQGMSSKRHFPGRVRRGKCRAAYIP